MVPSPLHGSSCLVLAEESARLDTSELFLRQESLQPPFLFSSDCHLTVVFDIELQIVSWEESRSISSPTQGELHYFSQLLSHRPYNRNRQLRRNTVGRNSTSLNHGIHLDQHCSQGGPTKYTRSCSKFWQTRRICSLSAGLPHVE